MALSEEEIARLAGIDGDGWSCADFPSELCDSDNHDGFHKLIETRRKVDFSGNAIRLHVGEVFSPVEEDSNKVLNLFSGDLGFFNKRTQPERDGTEGGRMPPLEGVIRIPPGRFVYFLTEEEIRLPFNVSGQLFMNPKIANKGLLFFTTGQVAPSWIGRLTGTLLNMTDRTVYLNRSNHVLYLTLFETGSLEEYKEGSLGYNPFSTHWSHSNPQRTIEDAREGELVHPDPGFARTTQFVTKRDLYQVSIISITALSILVTLLIFILGSLQGS